MEAGVVDLWWFGTACELLFGKCVSNAATATVWRISEASGNPTASGVPERICALVLVQQPPPLTQEPIMLSRCGLCQRRFATCGQP